MDDPHVEDLWAKVLADWSENATHAAFIEYCRSTKQLGQAAARYREEVRRGDAYRDDPTRAESAQKRINAITGLVMLELEATRNESEAERLKFASKVVRWLAVAVLAAVIAVSIMLVLRR